MKSNTIKAFSVAVLVSAILIISFSKNYPPGSNDMVTVVNTPDTKKQNSFYLSNLGVAGLKALRNLNVIIPGDISIICFADNDLFRLGTPGITVVSQPIKTIAKNAVEILIRQINQQQKETAHIVLSTEMIERESIIRKK